MYVISIYRLYLGEDPVFMTKSCGAWENGLPRAQGLDVLWLLPPKKQLGMSGMERFAKSETNDTGKPSNMFEGDIFW